MKHFAQHRAIRLLMRQFWTKYYAALRRFDLNKNGGKPTFQDVEKWRNHKNEILRATQDDQDADHASKNGKDNCQPIKTTTQRCPKNSIGSVSVFLKHSKAQSYIE